MSDLDSLSASLGRGGDALISFGRKALEVTARNVKDEARKNARSSNRGRYGREYPAKISYDVTLKGRSIVAEIGPELGGQGSLGGILETGGIHNRPQQNLTRAARANEADLIQGAQKAAADALNKAVGA